MYVSFSLQIMKTDSILLMIFSFGTLARVH